MGFDIFFNDSHFDPESGFRHKLMKSSMMKTLLLNEKSNRENRKENKGIWECKMMVSKKNKSGK